MDNVLETVAYQCPQCGSTDVTIMTGDMGRCNNCDSNFVLPKNEKEVIVKNEFHVEMKSDKEVTFTAVKKEFDETAFLRNTLISISADASTPEDILDSEFDTTECFYENYLIVEGEANLNYTASIGYDRKVEYTEYNSTSKQYVKKTKTVTDWQAYSGMHSGNYVRAVLNENELGYPDTFSFHLSCANTENIVEWDKVDFEAEAPKNPSAEAVNFAKERIRSACQAEAERALPGDRYKDFTANGTVKVSSINSCSAPVSKIKYNNNGNDYQNRSFAFGGYSISGSMPDISQNLMDVVNSKTKVFDIIAIVCYAISIVMSIVGIAAELSKLLLLLPLISIGLFIYNKITYKKLINNIVSVNQESKRQKVTAHLKDMNLEPLTDNEILMFEAKGKDLPKTKHKIRTIGLVLFIIAMVFAASFLFL